MMKLSTWFTQAAEIMEEFAELGKQIELHRQFWALFNEHRTQYPTTPFEELPPSVRNMIAKKLAGIMPEKTLRARFEKVKEIKAQLEAEMIPLLTGIPAPSIGQA